MDKIERPIAIDRGPIKLGLFYSMWCTSDSPTRSIHELCAYGNGCLYAVVDTLGSDALDYALSTTTQTHILHSKYCKALNLVQRALESPVEAKKDHVLIAVLLMGTVEAKISPQKAVEDWVTHIQVPVTYCIFVGRTKSRLDWEQPCICKPRRRYSRLVC